MLMLLLGLVGPSQGCDDSNESAASRPKRKKRKKKRNRVTKGQVTESLAGIPKKLQKEFHKRVPKRILKKALERLPIDFVVVGPSREPPF